MKTCLCCGLQCAAELETCPDCGQASWSDPRDMATALPDLQLVEVGPIKKGRARR